MVQNRQDRRVRRTRRLLSQALLELMLETDYESISVRRVTDLADVGYATFYRHFRSKQELLGYALGSVLEALGTSVSFDMSREEQAVAFLRNVDQNREAYLAALTLPPAHPVLKTLHDRVKQLVAARYLPRADSDVPVDVAVNHLVWSTYELLRWYLLEPHDYSLEQVAAMYVKLVLQPTEDAVAEQ